MMDTIYALSVAANLALFVAAPPAGFIQVTIGFIVGFLTYGS